ncbi:tryptophan synthase subunit alpha [Flavobacterium sp. IMCC34852]|uniref:Tryptophan synthase alpha chain n=1 Tax=Flavobacterium rivulicola TaxID=2732161 RepID=A0A7Y3R9C7_9FLAO|nr:tryptophan synthase subunit alpha [Flavobacterium sp. IMCC34852]NNT72294.1 tryptophan synthase subunit alpha [Flavobacterium sp. IMCC34852]
MNRIQHKLSDNKKILSIYFTAGFPMLNDTKSLIENLAQNKVDMIEIGLPFSDPLADGPTIQESSTQALKNGMTSAILFDQLKGIRNTVDIPLIIMGYFNPMLQFGIENFLQKCQETGIDGLIIPDLPLEIYLSEYKERFENYGIAMIFLITPQTSEERIRLIDANSNAFIYMVSSTSVTGSRDSFDENQLTYFERIAAMNLKNPQIIGFGISNKTTFEQAVKHQKGAIIGSSFIQFISKNGSDNVQSFIQSIL